MYKGQKYSIDDFIILGANSTDTVDVGLVQSICFKQDEVYFVVFKYHAYRNEMFRFFQAEGFNDELYFILANNLYDYKPLYIHGTVRKFRFSLHHMISVAWTFHSMDTVDCVFKCLSILEKAKVGSENVTACRSFYNLTKYIYALWYLVW